MLAQYFTEGDNSALKSESRRSINLAGNFRKEEQNKQFISIQVVANQCYCARHGLHLSGGLSNMAGDSISKISVN
jgi:hypothetical protein